MNDFAQVAADLAAHEAFEQWRNGRTEAPPPSRRQRLVTSVSEDLAHAAALVAAAASLANAIEAGGPATPGARALTIYMPANAGHLARAAGKLADEDVDAEACRMVQACAAHLALAQRMSAGFAEDPGGARSGHQVDAEILADAWRRACTAMSRALAALGSLGHPSDGAPDAGMARILDLLARAEAGGTPCLEADRRVTIPGWAERRRERRREREIPASATIGTRKLAVTICDVSGGGVGLEMPYGTTTAVRQAIVVHMPDGRDLAGIIAWLEGPRAGVQFDTRLPDSDPLLVEPDPAPIS